MKNLLFTALLLTSACTHSTSDLTHAAVTDHLKKNLNDPASYEAARWGKPVRFTRQDSAGIVSERLEAEYDKSVNILSDEQRAKISHSAIVLGNITDTTRVGTYLTHAYRAKNKLGALVLDSAQFVVYQNGKVQQL
jgi:hypothetical protein